MRTHFISTLVTLSFFSFSLHSVTIFVIMVSEPHPWLLFIQPIQVCETMSALQKLSTRLSFAIDSTLSLLSYPINPTFFVKLDE